MKIKFWLLVTYLIVMLVPLLAFYGLYVSINAYYQDKNIEEYFEKWNVVSEQKRLLMDPSLYNNSADYSAIENNTNEYYMITLYSANGRVLYASNPMLRQTNFENKNKLYKNLYELEQTYNAFIYKEPVYKDNKIIGLYKISLARTEWVNHVESKTLLVLVSLGIIIVLLYAAVVLFLQQRLNKPLQRLQQQMTSFAKGLPTEELPISKDEIGALTKSFLKMQKEILETRADLNREQQQKQFMLASLSHDLKTPLTSIQAYSESLQADDSNANKAEYLDIISAKTIYMKQLLDDLTMFSLLQSPSYEMELVEVEGEEFFEMLLDEYEDISQEKGFTCTMDCQVTGQYMVHPKQLMRVMDNLLSNAWTYTNPGGSIHIATFEPNMKPAWCHLPLTEKLGVYIVVTNTGATITDAQMKQLFDPLYQVDQARSQIGARGTGLGLTIAKEVIEKHHGKIQALSNPNETSLIIWLPKKKEEIV